MKKKYLSILALVLFMLSTQFISAQPWLYDFGTSEVTATNSNAGSGKTDLFENTPQGGGTYRVRIGAQGGEISVVNPGIGVGTDGELKMIAATGGSANKFSVYGWDSPSTGAYVKFELNTNSAGDGIFAFHLGNGGSDVFADNNTYTNYNHSVATFWIEYDSGEISSMKRRASGSTLTVQSHEFVKEQNQTVEIFANNASTAQFYSYDGVNYNLNSQSWDLWVDGVKVSEENGWSKGGNLEADENLAGFAAFAVNSTENAAVLYMDNLEYSNTLPAPVTGNQYAVNYSVINGNGSVAASVVGVPIATGNYVDEGSNVYFEAIPDAGYQVLEWKLNNVSVQTGNSSYYLENISSDANVTVEFEQVSTELYNVIFDIKNQDGDAITDAVVSLGEQTNAAGNYSFEVLSGIYNLTVVAQGYETHVDNNFVISSDINVPITLNPIELYTVNFVIKDEDEQEITNAIITLGDQTNEQGNYEFEIVAGVYNLSIIAQGYDTHSDVAFEVNTNETVSITLNAEQIAELPIDFSGPWKGELPSGWTENELGGDYANGSAKFDNTGDWLMVHFNQEAAKMSHIIKANGTQWNGKFVVEQSADGQNWTEVVLYEGEGAVATTDTEFEYELNSDSRYLKWKYAEKISGNIGIANIKVMLPLNSYLVSYEVVGGNGSIAASVDGVPIPTGYYVDEGSNVYFEATPDAGYQVLEWKLNSVSVQTGNSNYYFLENISSDANVTVEFEQVSTQLYDVVFDIKNQEGEAITDAIISLGEQTNEAGEYSFQVLSGAYNLTVVAQDYETYVDNNFLVTSDVNMPITLNSIVYHTISFVLKDENEESITNAIITLGDQTNDQGNYEFEIEAGVYNLSIIAQGYNTYSDVAFEVTANETVSITLNAEQIAELPIDFSGPWKGELPHGWTENELGGDYANGSAKFDNTGDWLMVHFNQEAAKMSHIIKANGTQWNGKFVVEQSADGQNWTEVVSYEGEGAVATTDTEFEYELNSDSRYLKWKYAEKISGNIGIANIKVMLPLNSYLVSYEVVGENGSLTASVGEEEIESGIQIEEGSTVVFKAMPDETHRVKAWYLNSQIVEDQTSVYYIVNDLSDDIEVKVEFEIDDTSIEENAIQTSIYPNPSHGKITIVSNSICNLEVLDIQGRILYISQIISGNNNVDLSNLNKGIYIVRIYNNQGTTSKTIIITD